MATPSQQQQQRSPEWERLAQIDHDIARLLRGRPGATAKSAAGLTTLRQRRDALRERIHASFCDGLARSKEEAVDTRADGPVPAGFAPDPATFAFTRPTTVFVWPSGGGGSDDGFSNGFRERSLVAEGIAHHPFLRRVNRSGAADVILWTTVHDYGAEAGAALPLRRANVIVLDFADSQRPHRVAERCPSLLPYRAYFKRSWVGRRPGAPPPPRLGRGRMHPIAYAASRSFLAQEFAAEGRPLAVTCLLRRKTRTPRRTKVLDAVRRFVDDRALPKGAAQVGPVSANVRATPNNKNESAYFRTLRSSQIVVTANHDDWEVDWRLYEAFAAGALVFADKMEIVTKLLRHPIEDRVHFVEYDVDDLDGLRVALAHFVDARHAAERTAIARRGYEQIRRYHMPEHRLDWVMKQG